MRACICTHDRVPTDRGYILALLTGFGEGLYGFELMCAFLETLCYCSRVMNETIVTNAKVRHWLGWRRKVDDSSHTRELEPRSY